ncbi:MAG: aminoacyl-tRNA hydrolase [Oscillospiraceae bacterium]|jgi:PTH1 family peptidyl-tRNA hydrolase|nr:aminoacyl-tRNA hydrolase [Oscillospiraceae bacterium]
MNLFGRKPVAAAWIVVFLGNPGPRYAHTRHNAGFMAGDALALRLGVKLDRLKFKALTALTSVEGEKVLLMKPQTFMNLSGDAVREAMRFYKVPLARVLAVSDDVALPLARLRVRREGSAGGHNGLKDITAKCGGEAFPRVKIGVGEKPIAEQDMADWVLSPFRGADLTEMERVCVRAAECIECIVRDGVDAAMNRYNG